MKQPWDRISGVIPDKALRESVRRKIRYAVQKTAKDCYRMGEWSRYYRIAANAPNRPPAPVRCWTDACFFVEDKYKVKV